MTDKKHQKSWQKEILKAQINLLNTSSDLNQGICKFLCVLTNLNIITYNAYMKTKEEILNKLREIKPLLQDKFYIKNLGLFGSYVRVEARDDSDLDILISLKPEHSVGLIKFNSLKDFLTDLLNIKVDLVLKDGIKPALEKYILNEVIYL